MDSFFNSLPLNRICYQDSTFLLEALLPYVAPQMKLPLAVFVKYSEFMRMLRVFQNSKSMEYYGLIQNSFSMDHILHTFSCCPNPAISEQLEKAKEIMQMLQMAEAMQSMQEFGDIFSSGDNEAEHIPQHYDEYHETLAPNQEGPSLDEIIDQIFKEGEEYESGLVKQ